MSSLSTIESTTPPIEQLLKNALQESENGETLRFDNTEEMYRWIASL